MSDETGKVHAVRTLFLGCVQSTDGIVLDSFTCEYMALINGLVMVLQLPNGPSHIDVVVDCQQVADQVLDLSTVIRPECFKLRRCAQRLLDQFGSYFVKYVPRAMNREADNLATQGKERGSNNAKIAHQQLVTCDAALELIFNSHSRKMTRPRSTIIQNALAHELAEQAKHVHDIEQQRALRARTAEFVRYLAAKVAARATTSDAMLWLADVTEELATLSALDAKLAAVARQSAN